MTIATRLAIFFATDSKILRRKLISDNDRQLQELIAPLGESMILLPIARPYDDTSCRAAIAAVTGITPPNGRCCVVDKSGEVIGVCNADPGLDAHPKGQLVASENAGLGDRYVGGVFLRPNAAISASSEIVASTAWLPIDAPESSPASPEKPPSER